MKASEQAPTASSTGELLRDLILRPNTDYQPTGAPTHHPEMTKSRTQLQVRLLPMS